MKIPLSYRDQKANLHARAAAAARTEAARARIEAEFDAAPDAFPLAAHAFRHGLTVDAADEALAEEFAHLRGRDVFKDPEGYVPWGDEVA